MARLLTEEKVLKKLKIKDFRHLTKDKIITMASMLDKMDPEVAKKALEQFPHFADVTKEMLIEYKDILDKGLESNRESVQAYYDSCSTIIGALEKLLDRENLSPEERRYIIEKMVEMSDKIGEKDSQNKKFILAISGVGVAALAGVTAVLASTLGGNTKIETKDFDDFI